MDKNKQAKVARFLEDKGMSDAVYEILLNSFLEHQTDNVEYLASQMISVTSLKKSWKELEKFKNDIDQEREERTQIGL